MSYVESRFVDRPFNVVCHNDVRKATYTAEIIVPYGYFFPLEPKKQKKNNA